MGTPASDIAPLAALQPLLSDRRAGMGSVWGRLEAYIAQKYVAGLGIACAIVRHNAPPAARLSSAIMTNAARL